MVVKGVCKVIKGVGEVIRVGVRQRVSGPSVGKGAIVG